MGALTEDLVEQHRELGTLLDELSAADWEHPSRCEGWTVADVVLHLAQTDEMALASVEGRFEDHMTRLAEGLPPAADIDEGVALMVARERDRGPEAIHERWIRAAEGLRDALAATDPSARVMWVAGELAVRTLATTRLAECWIHTGDVSEPLGRPQEPVGRLQPVARLAWRTLPYAFARAGRQLTGPVAFELEGPAGEPWSFRPDEEARTTITGPGFDLCRVAARRVDPADTSLSGTGPDGAAVLDLVRTYA